MLKSRDFLVFCVFLANQENPYWGQLISRLYYSYFAIARLVHIGKTNNFEKVKHDIVWQQSKVKVRKSYGEEVKKMRVCYDYQPENLEEKIREDLRFILEKKECYVELIDDAKQQTMKFYKHKDDSRDWIEKCDQFVMS